MSEHAPETIAEFEQQYADASGVTIEWLREYGRYGAVCDCGDEICTGFKMCHRDDDPL